MRQTSCNKGLIALVVGTLGVLGAGCNADSDDGGAGAGATTSTGASSTTTAPKPAGSSSAPARCPQIGFTPNSDDVATEITATGVHCDEASALVRKVRDRQGPTTDQRNFMLPRPGAAGPSARTRPSKAPATGATTVPAA